MTQPLRIAVADDEPDMLEFYRTILPRLGHTVIAAAANGRELVEQCRALQPDLVISDIKMPDMDGIEASVAIHLQRPVPVILVSAYYDEITIQSAAADHVMSYLVKPVRAADLSPAIAIALRSFTDAQKLENLSLTDELTGLHNRRGFLALAAQQMRLSLRNKRRLSLLFIDVDGLKRINDTFGHPAGDEVLKATADVLRRTFRGSDIIARLGGDEFCVLMIDASCEAGAAVERLLSRNVESHNAEKNQGQAVLSLSVGIVEIDAVVDARIEDYLDKADQRMYEQKQAKKRKREGL